MEPISLGLHPPLHPGAETLHFLVGVSIPPSTPSYLLLNSSVSYRWRGRRGDILMKWWNIHYQKWKSSYVGSVLLMNLVSISHSPNLCNIWNLSLVFYLHSTSVLQPSLDGVFVPNLLSSNAHKISQLVATQIGSNFITWFA